MTPETRERLTELSRKIRSAIDRGDDRTAEQLQTIREQVYARLEREQAAGA